jgi:ribosomal protein L12E/L44/L45/RPP1/RPP2
MINVIQTVINFETETDQRFINSIGTVYAPLFDLMRERIAYREQQKGVKGNSDMAKAWDIDKGIRDNEGMFSFLSGKTEQAHKTFLSNAEKLAGMSIDELTALVEKVGGNTINTICKNISLAGSASRSAKSKAKSGKAGKKEEIAKPSKEDTKGNPFLTAINTAITKKPDMNSAEFAQMINALLPIAEKQFANVEAKAVRALLENPAMLKKTG